MDDNVYKSRVASRSSNLGFGWVLPLTIWLLLCIRAEEKLLMRDGVRRNAPHVIGKG